MLHFPSPVIAEPGEVLDGGAIKGGVFNAHMNWVREAAGENAVREITTLLALREKESVPDVFSTMKSYPFRLLIALDRIIDAIHGGDIPEIFRHMGRYSATQNHSRDIGMIDKLSVHAFFSRSARTFERFHDFAKAAYEQASDRAGLFVHTSPACFSPVYCASSLGYYERCVLMHGASTVQIEEVACRCRGNADCTFAFTWEE